MIILISFLIVCLGFLYVHTEVHHVRKGNDAWDWAHKLSKWLRSKGY